MNIKFFMMIGCLFAVELCSSNQQHDSVGISYSISYRSKSILPWVNGRIKEKDPILSKVQDALLNGEEKDLADCLVGEDLSRIKKFDDNPFNLAILCQKKYAIALLAAAGASVNMQDEHGDNFVDMAYKSGNRDMVIELLKAQQNEVQRNSNLFLRYPSPLTARLSPSLERSACVSPFCYSPDLFDDKPCS